MAETVAKQKKKTAAPAPAVSAPRKLKQPKYASFRLTRKRIKGAKLPGAFRLLKSSFGILRRNWKLFLGIVLVYGILNTLLVQGFSAAGNLGEAKANVDQTVTGNWSQILGGFTLFAYLLGSSGNTASPAAGTYQLILVLLVSLALIWALRQVFAEQKVRVRESFYNGMTPLVPFVLVLLVIGLQLIPLALGFMLYSTISSASIAATGLEVALWAMLTFVLAVISLYMISSSIFALYIVTLPEMTPLKALRSARQLSANRRWAVMRKVLFLPVALVVLAALVVVPVLMFATPVAGVVFFLLSILLLPAFHSYMYTLYRAMI